METLHIYTDGGCDPNPGKGTWAWVCQETSDWDGAFEPRTTNQRMELTAIIEAIKHHKKEKPGYFLNIFSDSQYCVKGLNEWIIGWKRYNWKNYKGKDVKNQDLWKELDTIAQDHVTLEWVRGHNGNPFNERADEITREIFAEKTGKEMTDFKKKFG